MPPRRSRAAKKPHNDNNSTTIDPAILNAVNQAVAAAVAQIVPQAVSAAIQANRLGNNNGNPPGNDNNNDASSSAIGALPTHQLLEKFQKQKPEAFHGGQTALDAENWISHLEKIFEVLDCTESQRVLMATYKLEGDANRWWQAAKVAGGEGYVEALAWRDFKDVFYQHYFPMADREAYKREYLTIRQKQHESINTFMERFIRVAGIAGKSAGTAAEQAEKFKWALLFNNRRQLVTTRFAMVSDVANASKTVELERADLIAQQSTSSGKRNRDDDYFEDRSRGN